MNDKKVPEGLAKAVRPVISPMDAYKVPKGMSGSGQDRHIAYACQVSN